MTNIKAVDVSEIEKCLKKISDFCPPDNDVNQLDESKDNQARLTLAEVGDTAREALELLDRSPRVSDDVRKDAERYRWIQKSTGATAKGFYHVGLSDLKLPKNWNNGSVAQHLDKAIDQAIDKARE